MPDLRTELRRSVYFIRYDFKCWQPQAQFIFYSYVWFQITALKIKHNPFAKAFLDAKER